jgi:hypothetical protein
MQRFIVLASAVLSAALLWPISSLAQEPEPLDTKRLEIIEDLSESLANDLVELSIAARTADMEGVGLYFADTVHGPLFPDQAGAPKPVVKWIEQHDWQAGSKAVQKLSRRDYLVGLEAWILHFSAIEDIRFKVKNSRFDDSADVIPDAATPTAKVGARGQAQIKFFIVGRDLKGRREWAKGTAQTEVRVGENGKWQFSSFAVEKLESLVATKDLFAEVSNPAGVAATRPAFGTPENSGFVWHGATAGDLNNDGWVDLFVTGHLRNYLYLNNGKGRFRDASEEAGLLFVDSGVAPVLLDYDNDGDLDVFLSVVGPQMLLENRLVPDGNLSFRDVSNSAGVAREAVGFSAVAADVNHDGHQDLYIASYNYYGRIMPDSWFRASNGRPNLLFINQGDGTFREEAAKWGVEDRRWSYAAAFADVNGDGQQDLYVTNDFGENGFYIHQGDHFADEAEARGVLDPGNGMGVQFGDYDNDGRLDLHVTNMSSTAGNRILARLFPGSSPQDNVLKKLASGNTLFRSCEDGTFRDVTSAVGGFSGGWAWGGGFIDFDNDGWEDLYTPNGFISGKSMKDT